MREPKPPPGEEWTDKGIWFTCRQCGHRFWRRYGIMHNPCSKCGQHVGTITKMVVKRG